MSARTEFRADVDGGRYRPPDPVVPVDVYGQFVVSLDSVV
jgi:hypothetical protein